MKTTLLHVRCLAVAAALLGAVVSPQAASAQSELDASEAGAFLGSWNLSLESDFGPIEFPLELEDQGGKVAGNVGSPDPSGGLTEVTDITRSGDDLVLRYDFDAQGQSVLVSLILTPDDEGLLALFEIGDGAFSAGGMATKATN
jgi:hypothetical protein